MPPGEAGSAKVQVVALNQPVKVGKETLKCVEEKLTSTYTSRTVKLPPRVETSSRWLHKSVPGTVVQYEGHDTAPKRQFRVTSVVIAK